MKDFVIIHVIFAVLTTLALLMPVTASIDARLLIVVILYNGLIVLEAIQKNYKDWMSVWIFSFILSILMVFPDWYLSETLGALHFPDNGFPMIGGVIPYYMAGLWSIPFFIILFFGNKTYEQKSLKSGYLVVSFLSVLIFGLAELTLVNLQSWSATVIGMTGNLAWYIIIPELFLGLSSFIYYNIVKDKEIWIRFIAAFTVMILYIGNASFFYFLIETLLLGA
jgi:hypothetical protein